jgi:hypothetical protein
MYGDLVQEAAESELYGHMKCSQGGLMLLIRLRAQLDRYPLEWLQATALSEDAAEVWDEPSLGSTLGWLQRKFGRANATRALRETVEEILEANDVLHHHRL